MTEYQDTSLPGAEGEAPRGEKTGLIFQIQRFCLHDGPGIRTSVFFQGCPLACAWCANPECHLAPEDPHAQVKRYSVEQLVAELVRDRPFYRKSGGGVTLTGGEVLGQAPFALALTEALHREGISVAVETSGEASASRFLELARAVDLVIIDAKHYRTDRHREGTGRGLEQIYENIGQLIAHRIPHVVRIPVIPAFNDSLSDAESFGKRLGEMGVEAVQLLPFHQLGEQKYKEYGLPYSYGGVAQLHPEDLTDYADAMRPYIKNVTIGGSL